MEINGLHLLIVPALFIGALVAEHRWLKRIDRIEQRRAENLEMWDKIEQAEYKAWRRSVDKRPLYERLAPYGYGLEKFDDREFEVWRAAA